jgi:hypothetical protein
MASVDITQVKADASKLEALWASANAQYTAEKAKLAAKVDAYVAAHQTAANQHTAEIAAATAIKATIVPVVAAADTAVSDVESFVLSQPWYQKASAWVKAHWRWVAYGGGLVLIVLIAKHV